MNVRGDFLKFPHSSNTTALICKSRKENPQKLTQVSSRSHPRHLVGKRTAQKDTIIEKSNYDKSIKFCFCKFLFTYVILA